MSLISPNGWNRSSTSFFLHNYDTVNVWKSGMLEGTYSGAAFVGLRRALCQAAGCGRSGKACAHGDQTFYSDCGLARTGLTTSPLGLVLRTFRSDRDQEHSKDGRTQGKG